MMKKTFDCVELQHEGGREIARRTAGMTIEEKVAYWAERTEALRREQQALRAQGQPEARRGVR
jgi:hypothetical protein